jgi:lipopolysaccharide export system permease protein
VRWIAPVLTFALPIVLLTGALSIFATPWAKGKSNEYIQRFEKREDLKKVSPGQFKESASSNRVFFVEGASGSATVVQNVFVNTVEKDGNTVVVAKEGVIEQDGRGGQFLVLKNGRRYHGVPGQADFQSMEFERYSMRVATKVPVLGGDLPVDTLSTGTLVAVGDKFTLSELLHRVSAPITCLVLILLAIPLSFVNPRAGSSTNLVLALLIFFTYNNLVRMAEASIKQGKLGFHSALWPLPVFTLLCVVMLFIWRVNPNNRFHPRVLWSRLKHGQAPKGKAAA